LAIEKELGGGFRLTTNNRMGAFGGKRALQELKSTEFPVSDLFGQQICSGFGREKVALGLAEKRVLRIKRILDLWLRYHPASLKY